MKSVLLILFMYTIAVWANPVTMISPATINQGSSFTITQTGLYILSDDVVSPAGTAIIISSSNVDLNLNGKTLRLTGASGLGVNVVPGVGNITIRNGTIVDSQLQGIAFASGTVQSNIVIDGIRITGAGTGILFNNCFNAIIRRSSATLGTTGISVTNSNNLLIDQCLFKSNSGSGCTVTTSTVYISNSDMNVNGSQGVSLGASVDAVVDSCRFTANAANGVQIISTAGKCTVKNCVAYGNGAIGFSNDSATSGVIGCIAFVNTTTNYGGLGPVSAISVNRASQLAAGSVTDQRYDNLAIV